MDTPERLIDAFKLFGPGKLGTETWEQALERYKNQQSLSSQSVENAYNIALCEMHLHRYGDAEKSINTAIRINPLFAPNFSLLAATCRLQGKSREAEAAEVRSKQL